ncbi:type IV pilus secretin PilQ [Fundidesulfovibrio agrisoli]|uniref:type IV pilus secretin PilQ n=1 Tax=Fundidesulfovibrio agrisoli TaxID=2922717 RepID=UPI001FAC6F94|nr:type IV pilus secretin PilQ [Fundidesulfovibrio agrisoli]
MKDIRSGSVILRLALIFLLVAMASCAKNKEKDPLIEKWQKLADETKDKTYTPEKQKVDFSQLQVKPEEKLSAAKPQRNLPTMRVSLNFYNTDLQAVLRSMARIANQNIILSAALQAPESQGKYKVNLNVSDTPWDQAFTSILNANGLSHDWDGEILRVMTLEDMKNQNAMKKAIEDKLAQNEKLKTVEPMVTAKVQVNYADVTELEKTLKGYLAKSSAGGGGSEAGAAPAGLPGGAGGGTSGGGDDMLGKIKGMVVADKHSSSIIIQASREHCEMLVKLVEKLDEPRLQVHLKAFIVEATRDSLFDLGFQWGGLFRATGMDGNKAYVLSGNNTSVDTQGVRTTTPIYGLGPQSMGYAFNYPAAITSSATGLGAQGTALNFVWGMANGNLLQMQLTALAKEGKLNIVSEPSLTTLDNAMAFTENGERVPYVSVSQNGTNVQFVDAVLRLEMTPHVIDGKNLRMKLIIKNDEVVTDQSQWVMGNPPIRKKETNTTLIVEDGATIIISGLAKNTRSKGEQGLPGLKDIPVAGYLFKETSKQASKQDILVFITPTILKSPEVKDAQQQGASGGLSPQAPAAKPVPGPAPGAAPDRQPIPLGPPSATPQTGRIGG